MKSKRTTMKSRLIAIIMAALMLVMYSVPASAAGDQELENNVTGGGCFC
jgi:hypothetical protein